MRNKVLPEGGFAAGPQTTRDMSGMNADRTTDNQKCEEYLDTTCKYVSYLSYNTIVICEPLTQNFSQ